MKTKIKWYGSLLLSKKSVIFQTIDFNVRTDIKINNDISIRSLSLDDTKKLIEFHNNHVIKWSHLFSEKDIIERLQNNHRCYFAVKDNEIVGFVWYAVRKLYSPDLYCTFNIENHCAIEYNGFVRPDWRGLKVLPTIRIHAFEKFSNEGFKKCTNYVRSTNKSVIKSGLKFEPKSTGCLNYGYFLGYYFFLPSLKKGCGIKIISDNNWFRWKSFFKKRFSNLE